MATATFNPPGQQTGALRNAVLEKMRKQRWAIDALACEEFFKPGASVRSVAQKIGRNINATEVVLNRALPRFAATFTSMARIRN